ncbi:hypothetical protein Emtol_1445 [Emticicia oligotrophica DSM 17448]|uniref:Auto-transporter adhesin head GIN domain-containing protein n=1 Tax=Emticicia oligotrophica (strain DSM 17448 / CIP 109782 / MTCC 6937 / GPTSA100-15) TaxID=929562 RepID=A0ABM5MZM1_EMTOG|nr:hypothetical protein [Emticicia oligotrophica]AFK02591.1 hypothetical protein Emtol_1445 [Emticicia oligotrophica DSM 17448]
MSKNQRIILTVIILSVWAAIGGSVWYYLKKVEHSPKSKVSSQAEYDTLVKPSNYKTFISQPFNKVVLETDLGPVTVYVQPSKKHEIQFHQSFIKYIDMSYRGDTLILHVNKTPKSTKENSIQRQIYIYTPNISYYKGEVSHTTFAYLQIDQLKIDSRSSYVRLFSCQIGNLELSTNQPCNYRLEETSYFNNVRADINSSSAFLCNSFIQNDLIIKTSNFKNIDLSEDNVKKIVLEK